MADITFFTNESIAGSGTARSESQDTSKNDIMAVQVIGDGNSDNITVNVNATNRKDGTLGFYTQLDSNLDLAALHNKSKVWSVDVSDITNVSLEIINNGANVTVINATG
jgi:hypothetical protein